MQERFEGQKQLLTINVCEIYRKPSRLENQSAVEYGLFDDGKLRRESLIKSA
jgi:hypothetical protein